MTSHGCVIYIFNKYLLDVSSLSTGLKSLIIIIGICICMMQVTIQVDLQQLNAFSSTNGFDFHWGHGGIFFFRVRLWCLEYRHIYTITWLHRNLIYFIHITLTLVGRGHSSRIRQTNAAPSESSKGIAKIQDLTTFSQPSSATHKEQSSKN